jgi:cyclin-dependent kinase regulatory subunit CKS1
MEVIYRESSQQLIRSLSHKIVYSDKYADDVNEYRHVILPKEVAKLIPKDVLLTEMEWRTLGVQQSLGWEHYMTHRPEPHILLFRRPKDFDTAVAQQKHQAAMADMAVHKRQALVNDNDGQFMARDPRFARPGLHVRN